MLTAIYCNAIAHDFTWLVATAKEIAKYNFIGVTRCNPHPSAAAIIIEVLVWSSLGVSARHIYYVSRLIQRNKEKRIKLWEIVSKIVGEAAMGISISVAVVAFFLSTGLTIAQIKLTVQDVNILTIIALSFVLGFYHENTRSLLGGFHPRLSNDKPGVNENRSSQED